MLLPTHMYKVHTVYTLFDPASFWPAVVCLRCLGLEPLSHLLTFPVVTPYSRVKHGFQGMKDETPGSNTLDPSNDASHSRPHLTRTHALTCMHARTSGPSSPPSSRKNITVSRKAARPQDRKVAAAATVPPQTTWRKVHSKAGFFPTPEHRVHEKHHQSSSASII